MPNIIQVAKMAGVSVATISRVLNGSPLVTEKTKLHVQKVISEVDYHPSMVARFLRTSKSRTLLSVGQNICNPLPVSFECNRSKTGDSRGTKNMLSGGAAERKDTFLNMHLKYMRTELEKATKELAEVKLERDALKRRFFASLPVID